MQNTLVISKHKYCTPMEFEVSENGTERETDSLLLSTHSNLKFVCGQWKPKTN